MWLGGIEMPHNQVVYWRYEASSVLWGGRTTCEDSKS